MTAVRGAGAPPGPTMTRPQLARKVDYGEVLRTITTKPQEESMARYEAYVSQSKALRLAARTGIRLRHSGVLRSAWRGTPREAGWLAIAMNLLAPRGR